MKNKRNQNDMVMAGCQEIDDDDVCYYQIKCGGRDDICITSAQCLDTDDSESEFEDVPPETSTQVFRMPRRPSVDCTVHDILSLRNCCNGNKECDFRVNESNEMFCQGNAKSLKITYSCVQEDCPSTSTPVRPRTQTTTTGEATLLTTQQQPVQTSTASTDTSRSTTTTGGVILLTTPEQPVQTFTTSPDTSRSTTTTGGVILLTTQQQPVQTSTASPDTSRSTTIRTTTHTVPTSPPSTASASTVQTYPSSLSTTLRVHTSTTGGTPRVRSGNQDEQSMLGTSSIIGIAIGSLAFLMLIILLAIIFHRKRKAFKIKNTSKGSNVGHNPHYFTVEEFPNNQYEEINDVGIPTPTNDYNVLGEDNTVQTNHVDNYNHISSAVVNGQVGLGSDGYNHVVLANGSPPKIQDNNYSHIKFETVDYNQLKGHNSFTNPKEDSYHHILKPSDNEGKM